jgi:hypothetical protein
MRTLIWGNGVVLFQSNGGYKNLFGNFFCDNKNASNGSLMRVVKFLNVHIPFQIWSFNCHKVF